MGKKVKKKRTPAAKGIRKAWLSDPTGEHQCGMYALKGETLSCIGTELHACEKPYLLVPNTPANRKRLGVKRG